MVKNCIVLAIIAAALIAPGKAQVSYDTAIFSAKNEYCNKIADAGGVVFDRELLIDRAVNRAISIWKDVVTNRDAFRSRVVEAINAEGCALRREAAQPTPVPAAPVNDEATYPARPMAPINAGQCVAVINGVRLKTCSGRF
jgi:hypothetical protein